MNNAKIIVCFVSHSSFIGTSCIHELKLNGGKFNNFGFIVGSDTISFNEFSRYQIIVGQFFQSQNVSI